MRISRMKLNSWQIPRPVFVVSAILGLSMSIVPISAQEKQRVVLNAPGSQQVVKVEVLTENEEAYRKKIKLIESAKKSIRMMYYIYSDDETSSNMTNLLIHKAISGVKVDLLVDLHTNFVRWELFNYMERAGVDKEGNSNLRVRFYNRPNPTIIRDTTFMTATCRPNLNESSCRAERRAQAEAAYAEAKRVLESQKAQGTETARLPILTSAMLAGLYTKNMNTLKIATALGSGQDVQEIMKQSESSEKMTPDDLEKLKELLELIYNAKVKGSVSANVQLGLAMLVYGEKINAVLDTINKIVPDTMKGEYLDEDSWIHLTDFLHHKYLLVDGKTMISGGRNVENSYHVNKKANDSDKYIFRDTDILTEYSSERDDLAFTFDRLFDSRVIVANTNDIRAEMNYDLVAKSQELGGIVMGCAQEAQQAAKSGAVAASPTNCINTKGAALLSSVNTSFDPVIKNIEKKAYTTIVSKIMGGQANKDIQLAGEIEKSEILNSEISYLENVPYDVNGPKNPQLRLMFQKGKMAESRNAKEIHLAVEKNIRRVCAAAKANFDSTPNKEDYLSNAGNWQRIVLHQGYVILPGELLRSIGQTMSVAAVTGGGKTAMQCPAVRFEILTNSIPTTDLSVINIFAEQQIGALLVEQSRAKAKYDELKSKRSGYYPPAELAYFELQPPSQEAVKNGAVEESLHTKVFVFGDDQIIVGSANADVRSYYMDSNNAVQISNVPNFVQTYMGWVDSQKSEVIKANPDRAYYVDLTAASLQSMNEFLANKGQDSASTDKARQNYLAKVAEYKLNLMLAGHEAKKRKDIDSNDVEKNSELDQKIAKFKGHIPKVAGAVAYLNMLMFKASEIIVTGTGGDVQKAIQQLNLEFELL